MRRRGCLVGVFHVLKSAWRFHALSVFGFVASVVIVIVERWHLQVVSGRNILILGYRDPPALVSGGDEIAGGDRRNAVSSVCHRRL